MEDIKIETYENVGLNDKIKQKKECCLIYSKDSIIDFNSSSNSF